MADMRVPFIWTFDGSGSAAGTDHGWTAGVDGHELPVTLEIDDTQGNRAALRRLGVGRPAPAVAPPRRSDQDREACGAQRAEPARSEAGGAGFTTALTRKRRHRLRNLSGAWAAHAHTCGMATGTGTKASADRRVRGTDADPNGDPATFDEPRPRRA